jgi:hypothetical protein
MLTNWQRDTLIRSFDVFLVAQCGSETQALVLQIWLHHSKLLIFSVDLESKSGSKFAVQWRRTVLPNRRKFPDVMNLVINSSREADRRNRLVEKVTRPLESEALTKAMGCCGAECKTISRLQAVVPRARG